MLSTLKNNRSLTFYQAVDSRISIGISSANVGGIAAIPMANVTLSTQIYTTNVNQALSQLKTAVIQRGMQYVNNDVASRGGYMAENFVAESYNLDAAIKKKIPSATTPKSNKNGSADIVYDGDKEAGLKFNRSAESSAKAQTDPKYNGQDRVVPADQVEGAKAELDRLIKENTDKGRTDAVAVQQEARDKITDRIRGDNGVESTPLTKQQDLELAKAIKKGESDQPMVNQDKIDKVLKDTGITKKVHRARLKNELTGLGIAVAIGAGIGLTIGVVTTLAQSGITPDSIKLAAIQGAKAGLESGALSAVSYGISRTIGEVATQAATKTLGTLGVTMTENITKMIGMGTITIAVFSVYQFIKLKQSGLSNREALIQVGKQACVSLSILAVSIAAQGIWGGAAGVIVSVSAGIIILTYSVGDNIYQQRLSERIRVYTIEQCRPVFA